MAGADFTPLTPEQREHFGWLKYPPLRTLLSALLNEKEECARLVGGCVRDSLLGAPPVFEDPSNPTDIDIATTLTPDETMDALRKAGVQAIPTGYDHGTITAVADGLVAEITTLRADVDTDGRHATVKYTTDWHQDWRRRDFTINAIYLMPDGRLFDPAEGAADLVGSRVTFIGDAETRIREDFLRILRFYRFSARFAVTPDPVGSTACAALRQGLRQISAERINHEFTRILGGPRLGFVLREMNLSGVLHEIAQMPANLELAIALSELSGRVGGVVPAVFMTALWADHETLGARLKLSNVVTKRMRVANLAAERLQNGSSESLVYEAIYRIGKDAVLDGLKLLLAKRIVENADEQKRDAIFDRLALASAWTAPDTPFSGAMVEQLGVSPGPTMGKILTHAEEEWIAAGFPSDNATIAKILRVAYDTRK